ALDQSGAALFLAQTLIGLAGDRPWLLLVLTYATVSLLTEVITNNAAAILMLPIVLGMTASVGLDATPFVLAIMMAASASFATPLGYQTNLMVYGPGGYRFTDFLRVGVPMNLFIGAVTLGVLLLGWPLQPAAQ
ncbi:MAG: SLC13 family permease, partial [Haliea sp.]|uniref:SLC13 family permease n=1 Tax=Haliea sp. TaxID=1932666 RepID=UPI0032EB263D